MFCINNPNFVSLEARLNNKDSTTRNHNPAVVNLAAMLPFHLLLTERFDGNYLAGLRES